MTSRRSSPLLLLLALAGSGCVPEFDDDLSQIRAPRILAVRSSPAEAAPGETVELSVLVAAPDGTPAHAERVTWEFCLVPKPLTELGPVAQRCVQRFRSGSSDVAPIGVGATVRATLPPDGCRQFGPIGAPPGPDGISGRPADPDPTGGYYQPLLLGDESASLGSTRLSCGIARFSAGQTVRFNSGYRPNENPAIERLRYESEDESGTLEPGTPLEVAAGSELELTVEWAACPREAVCGDGLCTAGENATSCREDCQSHPVGCTGAESYLAGDVETRTVVERREGLTASWFASAGFYESEQTARLEEDPDGTDVSNHWTAPSRAGEVQLWLVLRDDRGGTTWNEYRIVVRP